MSLEQVTQGIYKLSGKLDFDTVPQLLKRSDELFTTSKIDLDLSGVTRSNSAGIALLLEWIKLAKQHEAQLTISNLPENMQTIAQFSGVAELLN